MFRASARNFFKVMIRAKFQSIRKKKKTSEFFSHVSHLLELIDFTGDMAGPEQTQAGAA
jgi:hypothetical protein